ncbi:MULTISPECIES: hypothetical protein [unclassified Rhizobium]|uniref:hypothetical protein n=1 Tax=unclassified Rhizobium TaxID=2613769 RepID=UPI001C82BD27|nr:MULTISPECIES: hypothetical protein [unclassified Rhizobium]MBX5165310.1 hypothetical protein [Rhizobium sp. NZLR4b]MBX5209020.1 hypothetical protein [Rhizobium sp. NZLR11]
MIRAKRPEAAPTSLGAAAAKAEQNAAEIYYNAWRPGMAAYGKFKAYAGNDVIDALRKLFHGKCAYCERAIEKGTREVEHYRPKGGVGEPDHPGYWWLAHSWTNLLPTCGPCNKGLKQHLVTVDMTIEDVEALQAKPAAKLAGKANNFPVGTTRLTAKSDDHTIEQPRLLDPTRCEPNNYLRWSHASDFSIITPRSVAGQPSIEGDETIRCLALNRVGLVEARTKQLNILRGQRVRIMDSLEATLELPEAAQVPALQMVLRSVEDMQLHCSPDKEFAAMATAFVAAFRKELEEWLEANARVIVLAEA